MANGLHGCPKCGTLSSSPYRLCGACKLSEALIQWADEVERREYQKEQELIKEKKNLNSYKNLNSPTISIDNKTEYIQKLRHITGAPIIDCAKAVKIFGPDLEKAIIYLNKMKQKNVY